MKRGRVKNKKEEKRGGKESGKDAPAERRRFQRMPRVQATLVRGREAQVDRRAAAAAKGRIRLETLCV